MEKMVLLQGQANSKFSGRLKHITKRVSQSKYLYLLFSLPLLYYIIFHYWPIYGVTIAFKEFNITKGINGSPWVGFKYIKDVILDPYFWKVLRNTLLLNIYNLLWSFPAPIILALLLNEVKSSVFKRFSQSAVYLPHFISTVVVCGMLISFLATDGPVNLILKSFGLQTIPFLTKPQWFRSIYIASGIWQNVGWDSIIYLAALSGVDVGLYEAAKIDGASRWKQMTKITLPSIGPTISIMLILAVGHIMSVGFEKILLLYSGPTYDTADVIATYVYRKGLLEGNFSYATSVGLFQSLIALVFLLAANQISKKVSDSGLW